MRRSCCGGGERTSAVASGGVIGRRSDSPVDQESCPLGDLLTRLFRTWQRDGTWAHALSPQRGTVHTVRGPRSTSRLEGSSSPMTRTCRPWRSHAHPCRARTSRCVPPCSGQRIRGSEGAIPPCPPVTIPSTVRSRMCYSVTRLRAGAAKRNPDIHPVRVTPQASAGGSLNHHPRRSGGPRCPRRTAAGTHPSTSRTT